jgi:hypothetical protein
MTPYDFLWCLFAAGVILFIIGRILIYFFEPDVEAGAP